jgi:hypothetical protein
VSSFVYILQLAMSAALVAWLIAREDGAGHIFLRFRTWLWEREAGWVAELFDCPYCLSVWVVVILSPLPALVLAILSAAFGAYVLVGLLEKIRHGD